MYKHIYYTTRDAFAPKNPKKINYRLSFGNKLSQRVKLSFAIAYAIDKGVRNRLSFRSALKHIGFLSQTQAFYFNAVKRISKRRLGDRGYTH